MRLSGRNLKCVRGGREVFAGLDLSAVAGEALAVTGPNGAGKTSLLRMMATAIPPSSGSLRLLGRDPSSHSERREIRRRLGYLPQNLGYYPGFTVLEFVEYFALLKEIPRSRVRPRESRGPAVRSGSPNGLRREAAIAIPAPDSTISGTSCACKPLDDNPWTTLAGGDLTVVRNLAGLVGIGLLSAATLGGSFAWVGPAAYLVVAEQAIDGAWSTPWAWPARPPHDHGAALCAGLVFLVAMAAVTLFGARDSQRD